MLAVMTVYDFDGKVALVTGGAGGIGSATVRQLAAGRRRRWRSPTATASARNCSPTSSATRRWRSPSTSPTRTTSTHCAAAIVERFGRIDLHVLNAGIPGSLAPFEELSVDDFDRVIAVNLRGTFLGLRSAFRQYAAQGSGGAIVITGSICSLRGSDDLVPYHASKHAVLGLMRSAAVHGAERGIRVNGVAPGIVLTDLVAGSPEGAADATRRAHIAPQRRPGTTDEVADLITFLLSDNAAFLTGEMVSIDGGATAMNPVRHSGQQVARANRVRRQWRHGEPPRRHRLASRCGVSRRHRSESHAPRPPPIQTKSCRRRRRRLGAALAVEHPARPALRRRAAPDAQGRPSSRVRCSSCQRLELATHVGEERPPASLDGPGQRARVDSGPASCSGPARAVWRRRRATEDRPTSSNGTATCR